MMFVAQVLKEKKTKRAFLQSLDDHSLGLVQVVF